MSASRRSAPFVLTGAAAALLAGLAASPAAAAPLARAAPAANSWTITRGGAATAVTGAALIEDTTAGRSVRCYTSAVSLKLKSGKKLLGADAGTVSGASFGLCAVGNHSLPVKVSLGALPWHVNLLSYDAATGVTTGTLTGLHLAISVPLLGCTAVADGTSATADDGVLAATYDNKTARLTALRSGGKLRVFDVSKDCDGVVKDGDSIALSASYAVLPAQRITGP